MNPYKIGLLLKEAVERALETNLKSLGISILLRTRGIFFTRDYRKVKIKSMC
jgi:hypothetical protein